MAYLDNAGLSHFTSWIKAKLAGKLDKTGGTVTGPLAVPTPTLDNHAATKGYADNLVNGITYTVTERPGSYSLYCVCFGGNGRFVAVGAPDSNAGVYSDDGINWTEMTLPSSGNWKVCCGNGRFVAANYSSNKAAYSMDGITWTESTLPFTGSSGITYGNGKFLVVKYNSANAAYSYDGITWVTVALPGSVRARNICCGNGRFVVVGSGTNAAYSDDGITWTETILPSSANWSDIDYGNSKFVAVTLYNSNNIAAYSSDGITWEITTKPNGSSRWENVFYGNGQFIATSPQPSKIARSIDGITWEYLDIRHDFSWRGGCYGKGKFIIVSDESGIFCGTSLVSHGAIEDLDRRKLELVKILDETKTVSGVQYVPFSLQRASDYFALFIVFDTTDDKATHGISARTSPPADYSWIFYGNHCAMMAFPLRMKGDTVAFIPCENQYNAQFKMVVVGKDSNIYINRYGSYTITGECRARIYAIP